MITANDASRKRWPRALSSGDRLIQISDPSWLLVNYPAWPIWAFTGSAWAQSNGVGSWIYL